MKPRISECTYLLFIVSFTSVLNLTSTAIASTRTHCKSSADCADEQLCINNDCVCKPNHVQNGIHCFPEAVYGDRCWFSDQCIDHRQICFNNTEGLQRCVCDRFHEYDTKELYCAPKKKLTELLDEKYNNEGVIEEQASSTFFGILFGGLLVTTIGFITMIVCFVYCFRMYMSDQKLDKAVKTLEAKYGKARQSVKKPDDEKAKALADAAIGPICLEDMVIG